MQTGRGPTALRRRPPESHRRRDANTEDLDEGILDVPEWGTRMVDLGSLFRYSELTNYLYLLLRTFFLTFRHVPLYALKSILNNLSVS